MTVGLSHESAEDSRQHIGWASQSYLEYYARSKVMASARVAETLSNVAASESASEEVWRMYQGVEFRKLERAFDK